jgi:tetratricopeptide (TPR) repeat protein
MEVELSAEPVNMEIEVEAEPEAAPSEPAPQQNLEVELDSHLSVLGGEETATPAEAEGTDELPDPDRQGDGIDFGDEPVEALSLAAEVPTDEPLRGLDGLNALSPEEPPEPATAEAPPAPEVDVPAAEPAALPQLDDGFEVDLSLGDVPDPFAAMPEPGAPSPAGPATASTTPDADPAAAELESRVAELLADARQACAEGRNDDAASVLARIFILDEENAEAQALQRELNPETPVDGEQIEDWLNQGTQLLAGGELEPAREMFEKVLQASPGHAEAEHGMDQVDAALSGAAAGEQPLLDDPPPPPPADLDDPALEGQAHVPESLEAGTEAVPLAAASGGPAAGPMPAVAEAGGPIVAETAPSAKAPRKGGKLVLAVVLLAAVGGAAWWAVPRYLTGSEESPEAPAPLATTPGSASSQSEGVETASVAATPAAPAVPAEQQLRTALESARSAYERGDFEAAVVAYNQVLEIDPAHAEARDGLESAAEHFRATQREREQLERARVAFEDGAYASALKLFYRLPDTVNPQLVQSYLVAGWYNMGLTSLKAGACDEAAEHFDEALAIRPGDPPTLHARRIAERYRVQARDSAYYRTVEAMPFRTVE